MVKLTPDKKNVEAGYTALPTIFKNMGVYLGDEFENGEGVKMKVTEVSNGRWRAEKID